MSIRLKLPEETHSMFRHSAEVLSVGRTDGLSSEVFLLVTSPDEVALIAKPDYPGGCLRVPSGGVENGELPAEAAARELREELGLVDLDLEAIAEITYVDGFVTHMFRVSVARLPAAPADQELSQVVSTPIAGLRNVAERLRGLPTDARPRGNATWQQWGRFRAIAHDIAADLLLDGRDPHAAASREAQVAVRVLGPVEVETTDGVRHGLSGRPAEVLSLIALHAPHAAPMSALSWPWDGQDQPVHTNIARIRKVTGLDKHRHLRTESNSYGLAVDEVRVDVLDFVRLATDARAALEADDLGAAEAMIDEALSLWRGAPANGELDEVIEAQGMLTRIEDIHLDLRMLQVEVDVAMARGLVAVARAKALSDERPDDGHARYLCALALYRAQQQKEALAVIQAGRTRLVASGLDLDPELDDLELRILRQDPELLPPRKSSFYSADGELDMYWGYRPAAHADIRDSILSCEKSLVVIGQALSTVVDILGDRRIITSLAQSQATITLVMARPDVPARQREKGGEHLAAKVAVSRAAMADFAGRLADCGHVSGVSLLTYAEETVPRHFFLRSDDVLYYGPYLSHRQGSHSHLFKLRDQDDGLYSVLATEIDFIVAAAEPLSFPID